MGALVGRAVAPARVASGRVAGLVGGGEGGVEVEGVRWAGDRVGLQAAQAFVGVADAAGDRALHPPGVAVVGHLVVVAHHPPGGHAVGGGGGVFAHVADLFAPGRVRLLPARPGRGLGGEEAGVAAAEAGDRAVLDLQDHRGDAVEEDAVVGHHGHRAPVLAQALFEPGQRRLVEVVGRLVEQQHARRGGQHAGQAQPRLLAAGQARQAPVAAHVGEAETVEGPLDAGVGLVAAAQLVSRHELPVFVHDLVGERRLQLAHPALHRAQVGERGVDGLLDRVIRRQAEGLPEVAEVALDAHLAVVGPLDPRDEAQQRGLARAVLPDDAGALAGSHGEGDVGEDGPLAVGLGDLVNVDQDGTPIATVVALVWHGLRLNATGVVFGI